MKIVVDAMGGDFAPEEIVKGVVEASESYGYHVILVGQQERIEKELLNYTYDNNLISVYNASEVIEMGEHPAVAFRKKKNASIIIANDLVKEGKGDAVVSAGSTGAALTASLLRLGRIKGIERPAISIVIPTLKGGSVLIDAGANTDCPPKQLFQFAQMGSLYAQTILGINNPTIGLLNIGEEETKGNDAAQKAFEILRSSPLNFIGNIEGRDIPEGKADVIVCDGFVGNIVLKLMEGLAKSIFTMIKGELSSGFITKLGAGLVLPKLKGLKKKMDYTEYGGAILLGVNGVSIIAHGSSNAYAIKNAIRVAGEFVQKEIIKGVQEIASTEREERNEKNNPTSKN
jgi:glycerol-3-phosphate acyltransferase PlsX